LKVMALDIVSNTKYWPLLIGKSIEYTLIQFFSFDVTVEKSAAVLQSVAQLRWRFPMSFRDYVDSLQNRNETDLKLVNAIQYLVILSSFVLCSCFLVIRKYRLMLPDGAAVFIFLVIFFLLANAAICANLSTCLSRYQCRVIWLLCFSACLILGHRWKFKESDGEIERGSEALAAE
jgi:hypothetical protein